MDAMFDLVVFWSEAMPGQIAELGDGLTRQRSDNFGGLAGALGL